MTIPSLKPKIAIIVDMRQGSSAAVDRIRGGRLRKIRERILLRDGYACCDCGLVSVDLEVDHVVPLHLGGSESDANRISRCVECHEKKTEQEQQDRGWVKCL